MNLALRPERSPARREVNRSDLSPTAQRESCGTERTKASPHGADRTIQFMPDPKKILTTIRRAATLFRATPGREGAIVRLASGDEAMVVGDLHGNVSTFA